MKSRVSVSIVLAIVLGFTNVRGDTTEDAVLRVGDTAPAFEAEDDQGQLWKSDDHVGKKILVLYFYPADFTPAGTRQACRYRDEFVQLADQGVELVGVSGDSVQNHRSFKEKDDLNFTLLSDPDGILARSFGVDVKKVGSSNNKTGRGPVRNVTLAWRVFAIDLDGKIVFKGRRVNSLSNIDVVLDLLVKDFWSNRDGERPGWIPQTRREWMSVLSREQYRVTQQKRTEGAFSGRYWKTKANGSYHCVCCGQVVFLSSTKFQSGTGWPSFWSPASSERVKFAPDKGRVEVQCSRCDAHLGHVFPDGPRPTGQRYCINSAALVLRESQ